MLECISQRCWYLFSFFFFVNDTATSEIYTLSLHDALPISGEAQGSAIAPRDQCRVGREPIARRDRKSTRLNSSHMSISYAVFCLKKKKTYLANYIRHLLALLRELVFLLPDA